MSVLISGATGFIALHIIDTLLSKNYKVIGTLRSDKKGEKLILDFKSKYPNGQLSYEIVKDISADGAFDEALKKHSGALEYVLHTASPFSFGLDGDADDIYLNPAVNGTLNMLKGIKQFAPKVKAVVVTSSFASIIHINADPSYVHTEESWNEMPWEQAKANEFTAYSSSKKYAEALAWKFVEDEKPNFTLTTVNPPFVFGPQMFQDVLINSTLNTSAEIIHEVLTSTPEQDGQVFDHFKLISVDVRDVALCHVLPLEDPQKYNGHRLFIVQGKFSSQSILNLINKDFPELNGKISKGKPEAAAEIEKTLMSYDDSATLKLTGIELITLEKSIVDSVSQVLEYNKTFN